MDGWKNGKNDIQRPLLSNKVPRHQLKNWFKPFQKKNRKTLSKRASYPVNGYNKPFCDFWKTFMSCDISSFFPIPWDYKELSWKWMSIGTKMSPDWFGIVWKRELTLWPEKHFQFVKLQRRIEGRRKLISVNGIDVKRKLLWTIFNGGWVPDWFWP